ncbi:hypothetical protein ACIQW5_29225 [Methylorubrum thiocyanatum]|uniref:hypothetical protein n=1 Tax=Methylorubrum thiocyanatum TaxID=47958 RepID=UPI00383AEC1A
MMRSLSVLAALLGLSAPARSQTNPLPQGEIRANGDITFGNALKLGKREGNKTVITPDTLQILGPGSTGPIDGMSVTARGVGAVTRHLIDRLGDLAVNVRDYGAKCDNRTDDATAIQNATNAAIALGGSRGATVRFPKAVCAASSGPTVPARKVVLFQGEGMGASVLRITSPTGNGINFNNDDYLTSGGGVADMSIEAGAGFQASSSFAPGSSGIGVRAAHANTGWGLNNVDISGFATGIAYLGSWNTTSANVHVRFFSGDGVLVDKGPDGNVAGGNKIIGGTISNNGYPGVTSEPVGLRLRASGGEFFAKIDITSVGRGVVADPRAGDQVAYIWFESVLADTSLLDGWVFDGSAGTITSIRGTDCWAAYGSGHGLVTIGPNLQGLRLRGMALRENGKAGWDNRGGKGIELTAPEIHSNGRGTAAGTWPGVQVADGVTAPKSFAIMGGSIGNAESADNLQGEAIKFLGTAANFRVQGVDMSGAGGGKSTLSYDESKLSDYQMSGNLPLAVYGLNAGQRTTTPFGGFLAAGATAYFEPTGPSNFPRVAPFFAGKKVLVGKVVALTGTAPGARQSFTYRLVVNGTPVGATGVSTGADSYATTFYPGVTLNAGDDYEVKVVGSSGASAANHRGYIQLDP